MLPSGTQTLECDGKGVDLLRTAESSEVRRLFVLRTPACNRETVFSPDGSMVARLQLAPEAPDLGVVGGTYGEVGIWGTRPMNQSATLPDLGLRKGRFSSDGHYFLGATSGGDIEIWKSETGTHLATIASSEKTASSSYEFGFALHEPRKSLLVMAKDDGVLRRTDVSSVMASATIAAPADENGSTHSDSDVVTAATSTDDSTAVVREGFAQMRQRIVDLQTERTVLTVPQRWRDLPTRHVYNALSHDGGVLAFTHYEPTGEQYVVVWDTRRNKEIQRLVPGDDTVRHLTLSPDGRYVSAYVVPSGIRDGAGGTVQVWDVRTRKEIRRFKNVTAYGRFSPDGRLFAMTSGEVLDLWADTVRTAGWSDGTVSALAFSPDGHLLALTRTTGSVELWDGAARQRLAHMPGTAPRPESLSINEADERVFSQEGKILASVTSGERVQLWDIEARTVLGQPLNAGGRKIDMLAFGKDGTLRVLGGKDVVALQLGPDLAAAAVCKQVGRDITREEWQTYILGTPYRKLC